MNTMDNSRTLTPEPNNQTAPSVPTRSTSPTILFLDGVRGLAALAVVFHHARLLLWAGYQQGYLAHPERYPFINKLLVYILTVFKYTGSSVLLFFVLSGFVIHLGYATRIRNAGDSASSLKFSWRDFVFRRFRRLYPALLFALLFGWGMNTLALKLGWSLNTPNSPYTCTPDYGIRHLLGNLTFLMDYSVPVWGCNAALWTLHYEWWFYMMYPLFWVLLRKSIVTPTIAITVLFAFSFFHLPYVGFIQNIFSLMFSWWLGVILAEIYVGRIKIPFIRLVPLTLLLGAIFLRSEDAQHDVPLQTVLGLGFTGLLALLFHLQSKGVSLRFLEQLKPLGDMSYSLYITHFPILLFLCAWLIARSPDHRLPDHFGWFFGGILFCVVFAYGIHFVIEKPFVRKRAKSTAKSE